jgi:sulfite oxidase
LLDRPNAKTGLIVHSEKPYNAEPPLERLRASIQTGLGDFFVRSHGTMPNIDPSRYQLTVGGRVGLPLKLSVEALRRDFPQRSVNAVLQCAGNRRNDMAQVQPVSGEPWGAGAIGNADWTGVSLADVLTAASVERNEALHVAFGALDECHADGRDFRYAVSIPISKAMSPEVLLAYTMNGEPLVPQHGAPLRAVVPGFAGVPGAKWLAAITVQDAPSDAHFQAHEYKLFPPGATKETAKPADGMTIYEMPLNSAICEPANYATLKPGKTKVCGWAVDSSRDIVRVDVSIDGGRNWKQAALQREPGSRWSWTFWDIDVALPEGEHEIAVRAWDEAGQTQPALPDHTWNFKGYLAASWHRIHVRVG